MHKHEIKSCPRCQQSFECKCGDIIKCQCESVDLQQHHHDYILEQYIDCLCANCLKQLRSEYNIIQFERKLRRLVSNK